MTFNIIHHRGQPNKADFEFQGQIFKVTRQEQIFVLDDLFNRFVSCAPYDNHFIFQFPDKAMKLLAMINRKRPEAEWMKMPDHMCTCGAVSIIVDPWDPKKSLFICQFEITFGFHQTRIVNIKDFDKVKGQQFKIGEKDRMKGKYEN